MKNLYHCVVAVLASVTVASAWNVGQIVKTSSGEILGHASSRNRDVSEYLGIPFAVPPLGSLRFLPPKKLSSNSLVKADRFVRSTQLGRVNSTG